MRHENLPSHPCRTKICLAALCLLHHCSTASSFFFYVSQWRDTCLPATAKFLWKTQTVSLSATSSQLGGFSQDERGPRKSIWNVGYQVLRGGKAWAHLWIESWKAGWLGDLFYLNSGQGSCYNQWPESPRPSVSLSWVPRQADALSVLLARMLVLHCGLRAPWEAWTLCSSISFAAKILAEPR